MNSFKTRFIWNKFVNTVDHDCHAIGVIVGRSAETWTSLKTWTFYLNSFGDIEKARLFTYLTKISLPESLLHDNIQKIVDHIVILHFCLSKLFAWEKLFRISINSNSVFNASELSFNNNRFLEISSSEYSTTGCNVQPENDIDLPLDGFENTLHYEGVTHVIGEDSHLVLPDGKILA